MPDRVRRGHGRDARRAAVSHLGPYPKQAFDAKRGAYNPEPIDTVAVEAPAGSVIFFESRTWHQSGTSHSDKTRYSLTTLWQQSWVKPMDYIVENLHDEVYRSLSQEQLEMLGFKAEPSGRIEACSAGSRGRTRIARRRTCPSCAAAARCGRSRSTTWAR